VAHHSVLLFDIFDVSRFESPGCRRNCRKTATSICAGCWKSGRASRRRPRRSAITTRSSTGTRSVHCSTQGAVTLRERALAERIFWSIINRIAEEIRGLKYIPDELEDLETAIADVYFGNFSVFQSLPDSWAIEQLFPIMPIHRLGEHPSRKAVLADITCDCDGKIDRFIDLHDVKRTLPLHEFNGKDYYMGVFLVGAYQETLGDLHNLLGDTNVVSVKLAADGGVEFAEEIAGDTVADVLSYVEYDVQDMVEMMRRTAEQAVRSGKITPEERREIMAAYEGGLRGYTYFEESFMQSEEVFQVFRDTKALLSGHFELRSGLHSDQYFQCAIVMQYPRIAARLCAALGDAWLKGGRGVDTVIAPAMGGLVIGQELGRHLDRRFIFAEKQDGKLVMRRFDIQPGERFLVAEDVMTRGGRIQETLDIVRAKGGIVDSICVLVDRSGGKVKFDVPVVSLLQWEPVTWKPEECPLCKKGIPARHPGS
jgi:orotate phosphoribosyltransferase